MGHHVWCQNFLKCLICKLTIKEQRSVQYEEITSYSFAEYISDLGGAAGLVLGLNLFVVFQFLGRIGKTCRDRVAYIMGTRKELIQIIIKRTFLSEHFFSMVCFE